MTQRVVAIVPAKDRADRIAATVDALGLLARVDRVVVVDDGSTDETAERARAAGAEVVVLPANVGKGGAVAAGLAHAPDADVILMIDADLADTAAAAGALLDPVLGGTADMTVGVLPAAGAKGGFGSVKTLAGRGIRRASGFEAEAPLSGQRAVRAELLRDVDLAPKFGLETALTIDAVNAGARVLEVPVPMDHRHTGRRLAGFAHRGRQGIDIVRALWPRVTTSSQRIALIVVAALLAGIAMLWSGGNWEADSVEGVPTGGADRVIVYGVAHLGLDDVGTGAMPTLDALAERGALAASSVRTLDSRPEPAEAWATFGAGTRVRTGAVAGDTLALDEEIEGTTAAVALQRRSGSVPDGELAVVGASATIRDNADKDLSSEPGALGTVLREAGITVAALGNADRVERDGSLVRERPVGIGATDDLGVVPLGAVGTDLNADVATAPYGFRLDPDRVAAELDRVLTAGAQVVLVDASDPQRAVSFGAQVTEDEAEVLRLRSLGWADEVLARLVERADDRTLLVVASLTPPTREWALVPTVVVGPGIEQGALHSPSTRRYGLVTLTDLAPTVLDALGVGTPTGMIGHPLRVSPGDVDLDALIAGDERARVRERTYYPTTLGFIWIQALFYVAAVSTLTLAGNAAAGGRPLALQGAGRVLRGGALAVAAFPLASFLYRATPGWERLGSAGILVALAWTAVLVALVSRDRRSVLHPLGWICGLTVAFLLVDVATGASNQMSSLLGYSPHTAARFTGYGNTAYAVLAATAIGAAALHVHHSPRRREAIVTSGAVLGLVVLGDGAPSLGSDVGGILSLVPVFGLTLYVMLGRRLTWRAVLGAGVATAVVLGVAIGVDLAGPEESRTHLGRFVGDSSSDSSVFWDTISRKWATNLRVLQRTVWTWIVPIATLFALYVLVFLRGWTRLLPARSALRAGVVGMLAAGILGWAVNDSGIVVTALVYVYVGPFLLLASLDRGVREGVMVLSPSDVSAEPPARVAP